MALLGHGVLLEETGHEKQALGVYLPISSSLSLCFALDAEDRISLLHGRHVFLPLRTFPLEP